MIRTPIAKGALRRFANSTCALFQSGTQTAQTPLFACLQLAFKSLACRLCCCSLLLATPSPDISSAPHDLLRKINGIYYLGPDLFLSLSKYLGKFRQNLFSIESFPTNSSMSAIPRESAEASPRFAYAIILTELLLFEDCIFAPHS